MKTAIAIAIAVAPVLAACKRDDTVSVVATPAPKASAAVPVDHLADGELLEGPEKAFGLALPRGMKVDAAFGDIVYASGQLPSANVAKYLRARVREGKMIEGDYAHYGTTTFEKVKIPTSPDKEFTITVRPAAEGVSVTKVEVRDATPTQAPNLPDDAARWKNAGLAPNGRILDPTHLQ